jgi:hypothetical protein
MIASRAFLDKAAPACRSKQPINQNKSRFHGNGTGSFLTDASSSSARADLEDGRPREAGEDLLS